MSTSNTRRAPTKSKEPSPASGARRRSATPYDRIVRWYRSMAPEMLDDRQPGEKASALEALEQQTSLSLPDDYAAWLGKSRVPPIQGWQFLDAAEAAQLWQELCASPLCGKEWSPGAPPVGAVRALYGSPSWLPIASGESDRMLCLDFAPTPAGVPGQVIVVTLDRPAFRAAAGFTELLTAYAGALLRRELVAVVDETRQLFVGVRHRDWATFGWGLNSPATARRHFDTHRIRGETEDERSARRAEAEAERFRLTAERFAGMTEFTEAERT